MNFRFPYLYIFLVFISSLVSSKITAQTDQSNAVVPIPLSIETEVDSLAVLQAKYDSLVNYINTTYNIENDSIIANKEVPQTPTLVDVIPVAPSDENKTVSVRASTPKQTQANFHNYVTSAPSISKDVTTSTQISTPLPIKTEQNVLFINQQDTPRTKTIKPPVKKVVIEEIDEDIDSEELVLDSLSNDSTMDGSDADEADLEEEAEGEFDNLFTGYNDLHYWDLIRDPNFKFEPAMIPAINDYPYDWDTIVINPYKVSLRDMTDTILIKLKDTMDCSFHPPAIGDITSGFGLRRWAKRPKFHYGIDVRMEVGDPVYAIFDGVVRVAKRSADYGYVVVIRHYNGLETLYAHFDQLLAYSGKPVRSGEIIGLAGTTGRSTGPHLHFEMRFKGEKIDPSKVIYFPSGSLLSDTLQIDKQCFAHVQLYKQHQTKLRTKYYVVKRGDTLGKIAYKNGVSVKQITRLNKITTKTKIIAGRKLRLR